MRFHRKNKYKMDISSANQILQNVLAAQSHSASRVPFDKLVLRGKINMRFCNQFLVILIAIFFITCIAPLMIISHARTAEPRTGSVQLEEHYLKDQCLYLHVSGEYIDYGEAYLETTAGERHYTVSYDEENGILCFPYFNDTESNIYIPAKGVSPLHILITPR